MSDEDGHPANHFEDIRMPPNTLEAKARQFTAAYQSLKAKKDSERFLALIKPMILSAKADGITDKELIEMVNSLGLPDKLYPAKLKAVRDRLCKGESATPTNSQDDSSASETSVHPIAAAFSRAAEGAST